MTAIPWTPPLLRLPPRTVTVTVSQAQMLTDLFCGMDVAQTATERHLSVDTIKSHRRRLYAALEVHTAAAAVAIVASGRVRVWVEEKRWAA